jgi:ATP-dependent Clp protease ATP-binding subunit ClpB
MDIQKLTQKSQEALQAAQAKAVAFGHQQVDPKHLLLALLEPADGLVRSLLQRMEVPADALSKAVEVELQKQPKVSGPGFSADKILLTQELAQTLVAAEQQAQKMRDEYV